MKKLLLVLGLFAGIVAVVSVETYLFPDPKQVTNCADWWRPLIAFPGGIAAWAVIFTLLVIGWQSYETAQAAKYGAQSAQGLVTSERAWFICSAFLVWKQDDLRQVTAVIGVKHKNVGQTPGFIREIGFAVTPLREGEELPSSPFDYGPTDRTEWTEGRGLPIAPKNNLGRRASFTPTQPQLDSLKSREMVVWVHGYVRYLESFTDMIRETRYCLQCAPSNPYGPEKNYFVIGGPPGYNSAT